MGAFLVLYGLFFRLADIHYTSWLSWVFYLALPVVAYMAAGALRKTRGLIRLLEGLGLGTISIVTGSLVYCIFVYVFNRFIDDSLLQTIVADAMARFKSDGFTGEEMETAMAPVLLFARPGPFSIAVFVQLCVFGIVTALLPVFLVARRKVGPIAEPAQVVDEPHHP